MDRLAYLICFTGDVSNMMWFYESAVGLPVRERSPDWVVFDTAGAALALHAMPDPARRGIQQRFVTGNIDARVRELVTRGVRFDPPGIERYPWGRIAFASDPEGNPITLWQPSTRSSPGTGFRLSATVRCGDLAAQRRFYSETLGLPLMGEAADRVELDTGEAPLILRPRLELRAERPRKGRLHPRPITFALSVLKLEAWGEDARERGLEFASRPAEHGVETSAVAIDPDGNEVTFLDAPEAETLEEQLAEAFEDGASPHLAGIRRPVMKLGAPGGGAIRRAGARSSRGGPGSGDGAGRARPAPAGRRSVRKRPSATTQSVASVRGAGPERGRKTPKRTADEKKARGKPAIGRAKKATIATLTQQKRAVASASKGKVPRMPARKKPNRARAVRGRR